MPARIALLFSYGFLALGMFERDGHYSGLALLLVVAGFVLAIIGCFLPRGSPATSREKTGVVFLLLLLLATGITRSPGAYVMKNSMILIVHPFFSVITGMIALAYLTPLADHRLMRRGMWITALLLALTLHVMMLSASPSPVIDVFTMIQESAEHLFSGMNPYATPVSDVYHGTLHLGYTIRGYTYLPSNLYLQSIGYLLIGDNRLISIVMLALFVFSLWRIASIHLPPDTAELLTLVFLFHPRALFVLEQSWTEPLILGSLGVALLLFSSGRLLAANIAFGFFLSLKQYLLFFVFHWFLATRRISAIGIALLTAFLTVIPFLVINPSAFIRQGVLSTLQVGFRFDSLSITPFLAQTFGYQFSKTSLNLGVGTLLAVFLPCVLRGPPLWRFLAVATVTTFGLLLFGIEAFCNYYYFVCGLLLLLYAVSSPRNEHEIS